MKKTWEHLFSEQPVDYRLFKARFDHLKNPHNGKDVKVVVLTGSDSCTVMAVTQADRVVLVDNYRFGISGYCLELPGGMVDDGEDHQQSAKRELLEETGYTAGEWYYVGSVASNPVFMDSFVHHYLALGAEKTDDTDLDDAEDIEVREVPLEEVRKMLFNGEFVHPHSVSGILRGLEMMKQI
ncbi:MAG: NUDIX hydrolase [Lewinellaceae bacterium]|nr:NUDIX hydrolase [Saprospiraceae bacterium]MCB9337753.1 NUDIX hydrolase [Lewinellaceae bacterium]